MAINSNAVFEIRSTATSGNVNGGGFVTSNASFITDGAATSANTASPVFTSATYSFVAGDVGHWVFIKSGTNWTPGWYQIASVNAGAATLTASIGSANLYSTAWRNFATNTVVGCATTASPTGATWSVDYSQSDSSPFTATDLVLVTTTTCTSATNPFGRNMVGNVININSGSGFTAGWYEIKSVATVTATLDRVAGTASSTGGTYHVGGAFSLGSSDDAVFELGATLNGARYFVKGGSNITYTIGGTVSISASGSPSLPTIIEGYASMRGDMPTGSTRPTFAIGAVAFTCPANTYFKSINTTGTGSVILTMGGANCGIFNMKSVNSSSSASRIALSMTGAGTTIYATEVVCYNGNAVNLTNGAIIGSFIHDSTNGISLTSTTGNGFVTDSIISSNRTNAITFPGDTVNFVSVNNTLYGAGIGVGILSGSGNNYPFLINTNLSGFVTGFSVGSPLSGGNDDYNNYFGNSASNASVGQWSLGSNDTLLDPTFTNVVVRSGSTATLTAGQHLVQTGATFQTWGITPGVDFINIKSGTGATAGIYGIVSVDSETQITLDNNPGTDATANKVWAITQFNNFAIGTNLKAKGYPGVFPGGTTTGYNDIGAAQRQESSGGSGSSFTFS